MSIDLDDVAKGVSKHINMRINEWYISQWKADDIQFNPHNLNNELLKINLERRNDKLNGTNKAVQPIKEELVNNILTNIGMQESLDRDIGADSPASTVDFNSIGTGTNAEAVTDTDLQTELTDTAYARLQFSVAGTRSRTNQTNSYAMLWDDTSLDTPPTSITESGLHWGAVADASKLHARAKFTAFSLDAGDILVIRATELHQNGTL